MLVTTEYFPTVNKSLLSFVFILGDGIYWDVRLIGHLNPMTVDFKIINLSFKEGDPKETLCLYGF